MLILPFLVLTSPFPIIVPVLFLTDDLVKVEIYGTFGVAANTFVYQKHEVMKDLEETRKRNKINAVVRQAVNYGLTRKRSRLQLSRIFDCRTKI